MATGFVRGLGGIGGDGTPFHRGVAVAGLENSRYRGFRAVAVCPQAVVRITINTVAAAMEHCQAIRATGATKRPYLLAIIVHIRLREQNAYCFPVSRGMLSAKRSASRRSQAASSFLKEVSLRVISKSRAIRR